MEAPRVGPSMYGHGGSKLPTTTYSTYSIYNYLLYLLYLLYATVVMRSEKAMDLKIQ